jgi:uncharacterized protein YecT (DUF1311 family)
MKTTFIAIVFTAFAPFSYAADLFCETDRIHPIDAQLEQEMDQNGGTTLAMREAQARAHAGWDAELNGVYRELIAILSPEEQLLLRDAQRSWLSFRDTEAEFWWSQSVSGGGSLQPINVAGYGIELLKARVCQLTKYKNAATPI